MRNISEIDEFENRDKRVSEKDGSEECNMIFFKQTYHSNFFFKITTLAIVTFHKMSCIKGQFLHTPRGVLWEYVRFSLQKGGFLGINFAEKDQMTDLPSNITLKNEKKGNHICLCLIVWDEFVLLFIIFF